jgi:hypothetical protein
MTIFKRAIAAAVAAVVALSAVPALAYTAIYRVDCVDAEGDSRGDETLNVNSPASMEAARQYALAQDANSDLCQANGDYTRHEVQGSGRFL